MYELIKAFIIYGTTRYPVEVSRALNRRLFEAPDTFARARIAAEFFGVRSGGFHSSVRSSGAMWSVSSGRTYIGGNGWSIELISDAHAWDQRCKEAVAAATAGDFKLSARLLMREGGEFTTEQMKRDLREANQLAELVRQ